MKATDWSWDGPQVDPRAPGTAADVLRDLIQRIGESTGLTTDRDFACRLAYLCDRASIALRYAADERDAVRYRKIRDDMLAHPSTRREKVTHRDIHRYSLHVNKMGDYLTAPEFDHLIDDMGTDDAP